MVSPYRLSEERPWNARPHSNGDGSTSLPPKWRRHGSFPILMAPCMSPRRMTHRCLLREQTPMSVDHVFTTASLVDELRTGSVDVDSIGEPMVTISRRVVHVGRVLERPRPSSHANEWRRFPSSCSSKRRFRDARAVAGKGGRPHTLRRTFADILRATEIRVWSASCAVSPC